MLKKPFFLFSLLLLLATAGTVVVRAENYPYRSDVLWVTIPNHADWLYRVGEQAEVEVLFMKYGMPRDGELEYAIGTDLLDADQQGTAKLRNGRCTIKMGTATVPCFRDLRLTLRVDGQTYRHHVKVGFSPEQIRPPPPPAMPCGTCFSVRRRALSRLSMSTGPAMSPTGSSSTGCWSIS